MQTFSVTNLKDSGLGSLRRALISANSEINSQIQISVTGTITLQSSLPVIRNKTTITGYNNNSIIINSNNNDGLIITGDNCTISNLTVTNAKTDGLRIYSSYNKIFSCSFNNNGGNGIYLAPGSSNNQIGKNNDDISAFASNIIANNNENGVKFENSSDNLLISNYIGTINGLTSAANKQNGILITDLSNHNIIGGTGYTNSMGQTNNPTGSKGKTTPISIFPPLGNLISGNNENGVKINNRSENNILYGNFIGVDQTGNKPLSNDKDGVLIEGANNNSLLGCTMSTEPFVFYNVCSGNKQNGLRVFNSNNITIQGNFFGVGANNATTVPNGQDGMLIGGNSDGTVVGGVIPLGNVCAGNVLNGIHLSDLVSNFISYNTFGGLYAFGGAAPNKNGILVESKGVGNRIRTCVLSGNRENGIHLKNAQGVTIESVIAGANTTANAPLPNGANGLLISDRSQDNQVNKDVSVIINNVFSGNEGYGIVLADTSFANVISYSFVGLDINGIGLMPNQQGGILLTDSSNNNYIGPDANSSKAPKLTTNYISGNKGVGVTFQTGTHQNVLAGNHLGLTFKETSAPNTNGNISNLGMDNQIRDNFTTPIS